MPGDPSSAAFPLVAALIVAGLGGDRAGDRLLNPPRTGLFDDAVEMGADLAIENRRERGRRAGRRPPRALRAR